MIIKINSKVFAFIPPHVKVETLEFNNEDTLPVVMVAYETNKTETEGDAS